MEKTTAKLFSTNQIETRRSSIHELVCILFLTKCTDRIGNASQICYLLIDTIALEQVTNHHTQSLNPSREGRPLQSHMRRRINYSSISPIRVHRSDLSKEVIDPFHWKERILSYARS